MEEISNKSLAIMVVAAILITIGSTALILRSGGPVAITGLFGSTQTGTAQFNVTGVVSITIRNSLVDFGAGAVMSSETACTISTDEATHTCGTWANYSDSDAAFSIENDGNVNANITVTAAANAATWIGGSSPSFKGKTETQCAEAGCDDSIEDQVGCTGGVGSFSSMAEITTSAQVICDLLKFEDATDGLELEVQATVPEDSPVGQKSTTLTFTASQSA